MQQDKTSTILIVDDTDSTRYLVSRALRGAGYQVIEGATGQAALNLAETKPDIILLDIKLPDINGVEVCRRIKATPHLSNIPILQTSATFTQGVDQAMGLENGADGYVTHPIEDVVLVATVGAYLRAREAEKEREALLEKSRFDLSELQMERDLRERFVATLSHDLRNPMITVRLLADIMRRNESNPQSVRSAANDIIKNVDRADRMIRDLLDANVIRAGEQLPLNLEAGILNSVVSSVLKECLSVYGERFVLEASQEISGVWDKQGIHRIIENLCSNAVKYGAKDRPITIKLTSDEKNAHISVHNFGNPIEPGELDVLFAPYKRSPAAKSSKISGWGLGLTLVKGVAEAHGGKAWVTSSPTVGTRFGVDLPLRPENFATTTNFGHQTLGFSNRSN